MEEKSTRKIIVLLLVAAICSLSFITVAAAAETADPETVAVLVNDDQDVQTQETAFSVGGLDNNIWTTKYGNLYCDCPAASFTEAGFTWGDLVTVKFLDQELVLPAA